MKTFREFVTEGAKDYHPEGYKKITKAAFDKHMKVHRPHGQIGAVYQGPQGAGFKGAHHVAYDKTRKERSVETYSHAQYGLKGLLQLEPDSETGKPHRFYIKK